MRARRLPAVAATVLVALGGHESGARPAATTPAWGEVAAVTLLGHVVVADPDGNTEMLELDGVDHEVSWQGWEIGAAAGTRLLVWSDGGEAVVIDTATGESRSVAGVADSSLATVINGYAGGSVLVPTLPGSGNAVVVDLADDGRPEHVALPAGQSVGSASAVAALATDDGAVVAVGGLWADTQIIAAGVETASAPGQPVAVDAAWVATVARSSDVTTIRFVAPDGSPLRSFDLAGSWLVADGRDSTVVAAGEDGQLLALAPDASAPQPAGNLALSGGAPSSMLTTMDGERLVVATSAGVEVFGRDGMPVGVIEGRLSVSTSVWSPRRCIAVDRSDDSAPVVVDTETGAIASEDLHLYAPLSPDGCTFRELSDDGAISIVRGGAPVVLEGATALWGLSPDGRHAVVEYESQSFEVVDLDDPTAPSVTIVTDEPLVDAVFVTP